MTTTRLYKFRGRMLNMKQLARKAGISAKSMYARMQKAAGDAEKAVSGMIGPRKTVWRDGGRPRSRGSNNRTMVRIAERSWVGCSWNKAVNGGAEPWPEWNVEHEYGDYVVAMCIDGPDELLGTSRVFAKDDTCRSSQYEPTPEDIRRACQRIQATWTPEQEKLKRVESVGEVCIKMVRYNTNGSQRRKQQAD